MDVNHKNHGGQGGKGKGYKGKGSKKPPVTVRRVPTTAISSPSIPAKQPDRSHRPTSEGSHRPFNDSDAASAGGKWPNSYFLTLRKSSVSNCLMV